MCAVYKTDAIVIKNQDYRDYDKLVTLFSPEYGRISSIVKGVKKPKSKLSGIVQSFTYANFQLYSGRSLDKIVQGKIVHEFGKVRTDLAIMSAGMCILELLDKTIPEGEEYSALFGVTLSSLHLLEKGYSPSLVLRIFEAKLIHNLGVSPDLSGCANHEKEVMSNNTRSFFDPESGGLICEECFEKLKAYEKDMHISAFPIDFGSVNIIKRLFSLPVYQLRNLKLTSFQNSTIEKVLSHMLKIHFDVVCKTKSFYLTMNEN
ncbi:DNA repair protein RecO [Natranaerobius trueperi]|uniref:DNA repair protein RecO n=1 Tax=Natranaerobius trueperi TaxID=759412 RepID=A0A226BXY8_9FIRM|nr:DNA repair protein RecO [Natranaerobius trueperi]OWZ83069.1 DNA repair protein RecO [Natranaerobius trueperi]